MPSPLIEKINAAFGRFRARDLAGAERLCGEILGQVPNHPDALHLMGVVRLAAGRAGEAVTLLGRALGENPLNPDLLENLGVAHLAAREFVQAETVLRRALELGPARASLHMRLGMALSSQGRHDEAVAALGTAAEMMPGDPDVHLNLGNALAGQERHEEALACYRKVLALRPRHVDAHYNIGTLFKRMGRNDEAVSAYQSALVLAPDYADCHNNLGTVYDQIGRLEEAAACYRRALELDPQHAPAHSNLGNVLRLQGRPAEAQWHLDKALEITPDFVDALLNLGTLRAEQGRFAEVRELYRKALAIDPDDSDARFNYASLCLAQGEYEDGWANFRWRAARVQALKLKQVSDAMPPEELSGKTLLVLGEQGIGDELFFLRFAPIVKEGGSRLVCQCNRKIKSLLERSGLFNFVAAHDEPHPVSDWSVLVGDLPLNLLGDRRSLLAPPLRLSALDERTARMRERLAGFGPPPYLGLTWRAGTPLAAQRIRGRQLYKEAPLKPLALALEGIPGTVLALQRHPSDADLEVLSKVLKRDVHDLSAANEDLEDMLALLALIDEYIGVSNTNMHLMAGIGKTARVLVPHPPEWRWMVREGESPWFPGFAVYRQRADGDWSSALARLADDLSCRATCRSD
jgi:Flp pilus assembly protein TadD